MIDGFDFVNDGRTFKCSVEKPRGTRTDAWWWFQVSTDDRHRYAPFHAEPTDTEASVRSRVVAYYTDLLQRRSAPATSHWSRRAAKPAEAPADAPVPADAETEVPAIAD